MLGLVAFALGKLPFSHRVAQSYERLSAHRTIRRAGEPCLEIYTSAPESDENDQWFCGDKAASIRFIDHVKSRTNLEIGSGPVGYLAPRAWMGRRIVIDPLVNEYRSYQLKRFGKTIWSGDIHTYARSAEHVVGNLRGTIDGAIVCRNALDHTEDPLGVLAAISEYAAPGCYLLLWSDIWHLRGLTIGHRNITKSALAMDALLSGLGFEILQLGASIRAPGEFVEYGRLARKR